MIDEPLLLAALVAAVTALAFWLDWAVEPLSRIGASLLAILMGAVLSNSGLVPASSTVYDAIGGPVTSLAIAWLLLAVDLRDLKRAGPSMLTGFALAVVGTALGALVGAFLFAGTFGDMTWRLAGTLTGTYSGGSVNFVAVGRGVGLPDELFAGATAADNLTTGLWLGATLLLPLWLGRFYPTPVPRPVEGASSEGEEEADTTEGGGVAGHHDDDHPFFLKRGISTLDLAVLLATGLILLVVAEWVGALVPAVPSVLWLTTLALIVGHTGAFREPRGALQLGTLALHLFFVVIGIHSRIADIVAVGFEVFFYTLVVVGVHGLVVYGGGRLARLDVGTVSVASQAAVGGPSSALAVAVGREWKALVLPGIIVGLLGYA
ncbi:MAG TPA: DUF819 family protein, partial [Longimicrobiales bacterium]|nr:DUF819 family protein [Longimicrobiales bacterium]